MLSEGGLTWCDLSIYSSQAGPLNTKREGSVHCRARGTGSWFEGNSRLYVLCIGWGLGIQARICFLTVLILKGIIYHGIISSVILSKGDLTWYDSAYIKFSKWSRRDGSVLKGSCCSSGKPELSSQGLYQMTHSCLQFQLQGIQCHLLTSL